MGHEERIKTVKSCLEAMEATDIAVFAVQDHFTFEGYRLLREAIDAAPSFTKTVLPGIELHVEAPTPELLDFHVIFSPELPPDRLNAFLTNLKMPNGKVFTRHELVTYAKSLDGGKKRQYGIEDDRSPSDDDYVDAAYRAARVTRQSVFDALDDLPKNSYLIMLPYSTSGGLKDLKWQRHPAEDQAFLHRAHLLEARNAEEIALFRGDKTEKNKKILLEFMTAIGGAPKACVSGTDAHELAGYGRYPSDRMTWILADPTFEGLLHAVLEPRDRVFIGSTPGKLEAVGAYPGRFIDTISVARVAGSPLDPKEVWFDLCLSLNPGLTAIIGNKGSGKSALADIMALLGNSHCDEFSFLNNDRFRRRPDRSQYFFGRLQWRDGTISERELSAAADLTGPERVKYLPQQRIEDLCNEIVTEGRDARFEEELRSVVFSHVPLEHRHGAANLDELIDRRSAGIAAEMEELRTALTAANRKIAGLEARTDPDAITRLEGVVQQKEAELVALEQSRPSEIPEPDLSGDPAARLIADEMKAALDVKAAVELKLQEATRCRTECATKQAAVTSLYDRLKALEQTLARVEREMSPDIARVGVQFTDIVKISIDDAPLNKVRDHVAKELESIAVEIGTPTTSGLAKQSADARIEATRLQLMLDAPMQARQAYLEALAAWQAKMEALVGTREQAGTLEHDRAALKFLRDEAPERIRGAREERWAQARRLVEAIRRHGDIKRQLYAPVQAFLETKGLDQSKLHLEFAVTNAVNRFIPEFLELINQGRVGTFMGADDGRKVLLDLIAKHSFEAVEDVCAFVAEVLDALATDRRDNSPRRLESQLRKGCHPVDLYDLLFKFEWLRPHYALQLDGKPIALLSPGEKGALLIVFYLLLDPSSIPLVIDQPEHNLDNESIVSLLVPCFREAALRRQVVVVTHNPNLAVVADADQLIHATFDRQVGARIDYRTGSLESSAVSRLAVDVLEGTLPAFRQRGQVYEIVQTA